MDTTQFGGTFWITVSGMTLGFLATAGIYCLKAKCNQISLCWGLVKIQRDVDAEVEENANAMEHGINPYQFQTQNFNSDANNNQQPITNSLMYNSNNGSTSGRFVNSNQSEIPPNVPNVV
jgi:hypothetical protein